MIVAIFLMIAPISLYFVRDKIKPEWAFFILPVLMFVILLQVYGEIHWGVQG